MAGLPLWRGEEAVLRKYLGLGAGDLNAGASLSGSAGGVACVCVAARRQAFGDGRGGDAFLCLPAWPSWLMSSF